MRASWDFIRLIQLASYVVDVNYGGVRHLLCGSENGKDAVSEMSTHCVNAFQRLTGLTDETTFAA